MTTTLANTPKARDKHGRPRREEAWPITSMGRMRSQLSGQQNPAGQGLVVGPAAPGHGGGSSSNGVMRDSRQNRGLPSAAPSGQARPGPRRRRPGRGPAARSPPSAAARSGPLPRISRGPRRLRRRAKGPGPSSARVSLYLRSPGQTVVRPRTGNRNARGAMRAAKRWLRRTPQRIRYPARPRSGARPVGVTRTISPSFSLLGRAGRPVGNPDRRNTVRPPVAQGRPGSSRVGREADLLPEPRPASSSTHGTYTRGFAACLRRARGSANHTGRGKSEVRESDRPSKRAKSKFLQLVSQPA